MTSQQRTADGVVVGFLVVVIALMVVVVLQDQPRLYRRRPGRIAPAVCRQPDGHIDCPPGVTLPPTFPP